jgi:cytochrome c-type biogenesis protein CcsB
MNETNIFTLSTFGYLAAFVLYSAAVSLNRDRLYKAARLFLVIAFSAAFIGLGVRWYNAGHPPLSNMYESMVCLSTFVAAAGFFFTLKKAFPLLEAGAAVCSILMIGIASLFSSQIKPLIPALQSYWLHLHVSLAFVGEACFALAFMLSYMLCLRSFLVNEGKKVSIKEKGLALFVVGGLPVSFFVGMTLLYFHLKEHAVYQQRADTLLYWVLLPALLATVVLVFLTWKYKKFFESGTSRLLPEAQVLDNLTYRAIALGYPLFTVGGLIFGMIWANKAWGRYWGWDPKESWALITFLVYSAYLHLRLTRGWRGVWTAAVSVLGFIVTMFTLFGVNFLISSLHSYAGG